MTEIDAKSVKTEKISDPKYKDRVFRLLWIQDICTKAGNNFYKVLFQDINSKMYLEVSIFPEFLCEKYAIGRHYKNDDLVDYISPLGKNIPVTITSTDNNHIRKISEVLTDDEYNLQHSFSTETGLVDFTLYNKRQFCLVFENEEQIIVFPCAVIGARYYFMSTSMRRHLFAMKQNDLYEDINLNASQREATITLKSGTSDEDAPHIIRFAKNHFAKKKWNAVHNSLVEIQYMLKTNGQNTLFVPLKIDIPAQQTIQMLVRGYKLQDSKKKEKILVFEILNEDSQFDFDTVVIRRRVKNCPEDSKVIFETKKFKTRELVKHKTPLAKYKHATIIQINKSTNPHLDQMKIIKESVVDSKNENTGTETIPSITQIDPAVCISVMEPDIDGDRDIRPAMVNTGKDLSSLNKKEKLSENKNKDYFTLMDFKAMVQYLSHQENVLDCRVSNPISVPLKYNNTDRKSMTIKESYDRTLENRRQYIYVNFKYIGKSFCLIEIDHNNLSNGPGTYTLTRINDLNSNLETHAETVAKNYVQGIKYSTTKEKLKNLGVYLESKKHPSSKKETAYRRWCECLLKVRNKIKQSNTMEDE